MASRVSVAPNSVDRSNNETSTRMSLETPHWYAVHTVASYLLQSGVESRAMAVEISEADIQPILDTHPSVNGAA
jgi:hypothetical protein